MKDFVGSRSAKGSDYFKESIDKAMARLLERYDNDPPVVDAEAMERVKAVLSRSGRELS